MNTPRSINEFPDEGFMRLKQVLNFIPISQSAWYAGIEKGRYPKPVAISNSTKVYKVSDIKALLLRIETDDMP